MKDDAHRAAELRAKAKGVRQQVRVMAERVATMPAGLERDMLMAQAGLLDDGARSLEEDALLLDPARGVADGEDVDGHRRLTWQGRDALDVDHVVVPALAGEPPGTGKVLRHLRVLAHVGVPAALGAKRATSWGDLIGGTPSRRCRGRAAGSSRSRSPRA